jgi:hypothetical protein
MRGAHQQTNENGTQIFLISLISLIFIRQMSLCDRFASR